METSPTPSDVDGNGTGNSHGLYFVLSLESLHDILGPLILGLPSSELSSVLWSYSPLTVPYHAFTVTHFYPRPRLCPAKLTQSNIRPRPHTEQGATTYTTVHRGFDKPRQPSTGLTYTSDKDGSRWTDHPPWLSYVNGTVVQLGHKSMC